MSNVGQYAALPVVPGIVFEKCHRHTGNVTTPEKNPSRVRSVHNITRVRNITTRVRSVHNITRVRNMLAGAHAEG